MQKHTNKVSSTCWIRQNIARWWRTHLDWKREFFDTNFEIGKPCWHFDWMLQFLSGQKYWSIQLKHRQGFPISKLRTLFSVYAGANGHMVKKQEMEMETEMETENWNRNSCMVVSNHWTGLTQTTSFGVGQKLNIFIQPINCSRAWSGIFPRVSGGQRSRAYLISCNEKIRRALILSRNQFLALIEAYRNRIVSSITVTLMLIC